MAKLVRYQSFKALKLDAEPTNKNSSKSVQRYEEMVNFVDLLRRRFVEKKGLQKKNVKLS